MSYSLLRNLLFLLSPETSHNAAMSGIRWADKLGLLNNLFPKPKDKPVTVMGIDFPNPIGLAAGLDKNGDYIDGLAALGFGFIEIGTVTPRPQPGNPKPRLFRLPEHEAIINRMGFNNKGVDYLIERVTASNYSGVLGINIGKSFDTPIENALDDYLVCLRKVYKYASYITINVSSPNTPGLRNLQFGNSLVELLSRLKEEQAKLAQQQGIYKPLAVKIAPDMSAEETALVAEAIRAQEIDAVIATNTTLSRDAVQGHQHANEAGGLSGKPVEEMSTETVHTLVAELEHKVPVIGVGGIIDAVSAQTKFDAGADLIQVYTGFIYRGPKLLGDILKVH